MFQETYDFSDVLIKPCYTLLSSRSQVNLERSFKFKYSPRTLKCIPIMAANMDTTGTIGVMKSLAPAGLFTVLHKFVSVEEFKENKEFLEKYQDNYAVSTGTNNLEYTFFNLFPQNLSAVQVGYDASKILTASCAFEYTRYVCGPISNISKYRSGAGYNNLTIADVKERLQSENDVTRPDVEEQVITTTDSTISLSGSKKKKTKPQYQINREKQNKSRRSSFN